MLYNIGQIRNIVEGDLVSIRPGMRRVSTVMGNMGLLNELVLALAANTMLVLVCAFLDLLHFLRRFLLYIILLIVYIYIYIYINVLINMCLYTQDK